MHIVYVSREYPPSLRCGGIASYVYEMAHALSSLGHKITVICASDDTRVESIQTDGNVRVIRLSGGDFYIPRIEGSGLFNKLRSITRFYSYRKAIREAILSLDNVDIIEVPEYGAEAYFLMDLKIPVVLRLHTPTALDRSSLKKRRYKVKQFPEAWIAYQEKRLIRKATYITSCSQNLANWCVTEFKLNPAIIKRIFNPIRPEVWSSPSEKTRASLSILYAGTVAQEKGVGDLIQACQILTRRGLPVNLTIAGKLGQYGRSLAENAPKWSKFIGNVPRSALLHLYSSHEIGVFPAWWDNMPLVCIESMASGCITLTSNRGGISEIITDGENGFLTSPKDPQNLADKIHQILLMDEAEKEIVRVNAQRTIEERLSTNVICAETIKYFEHILQQN